ncbi:hypothetical protein FBZ93_12273 [Bradyrhizobium macuxiense]|uniref:Uncharacterized protein n=1 Tax=Bradyrhizobium macuxiense TaxID=1755647 RepID=A0A560KVQ8_9BRAD|nr:hypothetical protein [Bradyrhizobium macuxiense]TWB87292.1 hypothetical protein FBZ93_12273 [Bradyrhizobium macuxiense]
MEREHSTPERGPIGEIMQSQCHDLDARRDVARRALEQKLASVYRRRAAVDDLRFRVYYGLTSAVPVVVCCGSAS